MPQKQYDVEKVLAERKARVVRIRKADAEAKKKRENSRLARLKRGIKLLLRGPEHSPAGKKYLKEKKSKDTARTKTVTKNLRTSGLTEKEINRLRGRR